MLDAEDAGEEALIGGVSGCWCGGVVVEVGVYFVDGGDEGVCDVDGVGFDAVGVVLLLFDVFFESG